MRTHTYARIDCISVVPCARREKKMETPVCVILLDSERESPPLNIQSSSHVQARTYIST